MDRFLNGIDQAAHCIELPEAQPPRLPDADDRLLVRLAEASGARLIIINNLRHLAPARAHGVAVLPPGDFLRILPPEP